MEQKLYNPNTKRYTVDLTGQRFGTRVVTAYDMGTGKFLCQCDCGKEDWVMPSPLKAGRGNSCMKCARKATDETTAHANVKDLTGQVFGKWTVLHRSDVKSSSRQVQWVSRCECGSESHRSGAILRNGNSTGCRDCRHKSMERTAIKGQYYTMRRHAELREIAWNIDEEYFLKLIEEQDYKCKLTGLPICFATSRQDYMHGGATASLDRIDSALDYTPGNLQWVHKDVNRIKMDLKQDRFIELCRLITNNTKV